MRHRIVSVVAAGSFILTGANCAKQAQNESSNLAPAPDVSLSVEGHHSSPWEWGPSIRGTIPLQFNVARITIHPMGSYTRLMYDGGHEDRFEIGAQVRRQIVDPKGQPQFWLGAELAYAFLHDSYDTGSDSYNGPSATALIGIPITRSLMNPTIVGGVGIADYSNQGYNVRVGLSISPFR